LALKCKKCEDKTCAKLIDESCPAASQDNKEPACLTHIYKDVNKVEIVDKMCAIKDKNAKYECVPLSQTEMVKCETCNTDFCNSAPSLGSGALATFQSAKNLCS
ncbi:uncharacterized protein BDFB_006370, partial [Asbolus verrucosus]